MNKTVSRTVLDRWYKHCKPYLACHSTARMVIEREIKEPLRSNEMAATVKRASYRGFNPQSSKELTRWSLEPYLLPHEYLYLLSNAEDRLETIKRVHKRELVSEKGDINHWELLNNAGKQRVSSISGFDAFIGLSY